MNNNYVNGKNALTVELAGSTVTFCGFIEGVSEKVRAVTSRVESPCPLLLTATNQTLYSVYSAKPVNSCDVDSMSKSCSSAEPTY